MNLNLKNELIFRTSKDQDMRRKFIDNIGEWDESIDATNTIFLKEYVLSNGWPKISEVGAEGSLAAWLLVQHADEDSDFQIECIALMKAMPEEEVDRARIAFLEDRILINQNKPQLYGTQFKMGDNFGPLLIEDPANLNARRATMGLTAFEEYEKEMSQHAKNTN